MTKVSVIIPVYNVEDYLAECLESVIRQTYEDLEILCINDCSTDSSLQILKEYARRDPRISIVENQRNGGLAYTRNVGIRRAVGEYILFVDSDDVICTDLVERCMEAGGGCDLVCFDYKQTADGKNCCRQYAYKVADGLYDGESFFEESVNRESIIFAAWAKLFSRRFLTENHILFYEGILYEDILFSFQCYVNAEKVYNLNRKLYEYRIRGDSIMTKEPTGKSIESYVICICELTRFYLQTDMKQEMGHAVEGYIRKVCREYISTCRKWDGRELKPGLLKGKTEYLKLYRTFSELFIYHGKISSMSSGQLEKIRQYPYVILYGAGDIARSTIEVLDRYDISLHGIAVSNGHEKRKSLLGNPVKELREYSGIKDRCLILIGTIPRYFAEIRSQLQENGFLDWMEVIEVCEEEENGR